MQQRWGPACILSLSLGLSVRSPAPVSHPHRLDFPSKSSSACALRARFSDDDDATSHIYKYPTAVSRRFSGAFQLFSPSPHAFFQYFWSESSETKFWAYRPARCFVFNEKIQNLRSQENMPDDVSREQAKTHTRYRKVKEENETRGIRYKNEARKKRETSERRETAHRLERYSASSSHLSESKTKRVGRRDSL